MPAERLEADPHLLPLIEPRQDPLAVGPWDVEAGLGEHEVETRKRKRRAVLRRNEDRRSPLAALAYGQPRELEDAGNRGDDAVPPDAALDRSAARQGERHRLAVELLVHRCGEGDLGHPLVLPAEVGERLQANIEALAAEQIRQVVPGSVGGLAPTEPRSDPLREFTDDAEDERLVEHLAHQAVPLKSAANGSQYVSGRIW